VSDKGVAYAAETSGVRGRSARVEELSGNLESL
jgi:hypothetical protein